MAAEFTFKRKERITTKRLAMLAKAGGIRPSKEAGEMENDYAIVSIAPAVNPKTGRVIEGKHGNSRRALNLARHAGRKRRRLNGR